MYDSENRFSFSNCSLLYGEVDEPRRAFSAFSLPTHTMRRNAIRRAKNLDESQTQEAMKVLEKFCRKKYRNSVFVSQNDLDMESCTPTGLPNPGMLGASRQVTVDRASTVFSHLPTFEGRPPLSPGGLTFDFTEPSVKEEIKFDKTRDTLWTYTARVGSYSYRYLGLKHVVYLFVLVSYVLLGGFIFQFLEQANGIELDQARQSLHRSRHSMFSQKIISDLHKSDCLRRLTNETTASIQLEQENSLCNTQLIQLLRDYDERFKTDYGFEEKWDWDYWNAVFFAGTIVTTIGYGNIACETTTGRIVTIIYALVGIPLMLVILNIIGKALFRRVQQVWLKAKISLLAAPKSVRVLLLSRKTLERTATVESVASLEVAEYHKSKNDIKIQEEINHDLALEETFPMPLAMAIVFIFIIISSLVFSIWEDWDLFTAFYFTFISMSTIGLGDIIPAHPKYNCLLFIFYFVGLGLMSMCVAIVQTRFENKYYWALQLIDQEAPAAVHPIEDDKPKILTESDGGFKTCDGNIRWRNGDDSPDGSLARVKSTQRMSTMIINAPGEAPQIAPPVLSVFMAKTAMGSKRKSSIARSESILSRSSLSSKFRPFSNSPCNSELLTPSDTKNRSPWPFGSSNESYSAGQSLAAPTPTGMRSIASSMNSLAARPTTSAPLSVITEVSDDDTMHSRRSTRKPITEMLKNFERPTLAESEQFTLNSSSDSDGSAYGRRPPRLRRSSAQDLETPTTEMIPLSPGPERPSNLFLHPVILSEDENEEEEEEIVEKL